MFVRSLLMAAALCALTAQPRAQAEPAPADKASPGLAEQLGQSFVVGIPGPDLDEETATLLRRIQPGGVVLYRRNFTSPAQLKKLIADLQALARESAPAPYLIMIDEEPGGAGRLGLFHNVFALGEPDWKHIEHDIAAMQWLGINVDLAPVADFPFNPDSFIKRRVPAHNVAALKEFNRSFCARLRQHGIAATLKHFPGMGIFPTDPHTGVVTGKINAQTLAASLDIFRDGIRGGCELVMTNHATYETIDPAHPATLSPKVVGLLRNQLGFKGLILTDDLSDMPLAAGHPVQLSDAAARSLKAGHTMVMFSHKLSRTAQIAHALYTHAAHDPDLQAIIKRNYSKIVGFKKRRAPAHR